MNNKEFNRKLSDTKYRLKKDTEFGKDFPTSLKNDAKDTNTVMRDYGDYSTKEMYETGEEFYKNLHEKETKNKKHC